MHIWIIRHAKSSWRNPGQADFERPLNGRGKRDGPAMQRWLAEQDAPAAWIWTSDARRALATTQFVQDGFGQANTTIAAERRLYLAGQDTCLDLLKQTPEDVQSVALVAHNPGLTSLVNRLSPALVTDNLPTFGIARFTYEGLWVELEFGKAELDFLVSPKKLVL